MPDPSSSAPSDAAAPPAAPPPQPPGPARRVFDTGDWGRARRIARQAGAAASDNALAGDARDVLTRLRPDPVAVVIAALAWLVLVAVAVAGIAASAR